MEFYILQFHLSISAVDILNLCFYQKNIINTLLSSFRMYTIQANMTYLSHIYFNSYLFRKCKRWSTMKTVSLFTARRFKYNNLIWNLEKQLNLPTLILFHYKNRCTREGCVGTLARILLTSFLSFTFSHVQDII